MANGTTSGDRQYQILTQSNTVGLCASGDNGDGTGNSMNSASRGDITVLGDGEIYNLPELKKELNTESYSSNSTLCDFIMSAYEAWGPGSFSKLNGIYAIALWDKTRGKLYLTRDSHGVKSLYFHFSENSGLTFASSLRDIFRRKNISPDIDIASVHEYLRFLDISVPNTIYKNVFSLEPGCIFECDRRGYTLKMPNLKSQVISPFSLDEALNRADYLLTKSVEKRLDTGKTGFFLSGGIDSSLLCALGAKINPGKIDAFTVGFDNEELNEMPIAKRIAGHLDVNHHELYFKIDQYLEAFDTIVSSIDSPFADPATVPTILCFDYCKTHMDVAIDGTGADGLFGAMPPRYIRFALSYSSKLPNILRKKIVSFMKNRNKLNEYTPMFDFEEPQELLIRWKGWTKREIEELCNIRCSFDNTTFYKVFNKNSKLNSLEFYSALLSNMPDDRLHEMAYLCGLTVRFPYWDDEFVDFVKGLQLNYKYYDGMPKFLLRKLLGKYVPEKLWNVPKHGFNFPFECC